MNELIERIGIPMFIQIAVESWNELLLLLLISAMLIGIRRDKTDDLPYRKNIPLTTELTVFYSLAFLYDLFDIMDIAFGNSAAAYSYTVIRVGVFGYYLTGGLQTLFFLQVIKTHTAETANMKKAVSAFQILQIPNFILLLITPFTESLYYINGANEYERSWGYYVWQGITIISFVFIGAVIIICRKKTDPFMKEIIVTAVVFPLIAFIGGLFITDISLNNIMVAAAALVMFMFYEKNKTRISVRNVCELEKTRTQLAENRLAAMTAQIKPHFINNSMNAIIELCYSDPEKAAETIGHFSGFLQGKLDAADREFMTPFLKEIDLIKEYIFIEYADSNKKFRVEYDLGYTDFSLPALTVQPLVENAVKHGIDRYSENSLVKIVSREIGDDICITVTDNGTAEKSDNVKTNEKRSIGLENVSERLLLMCGGELSVGQSESGTCARIRIPKEIRRNIYAHSNG